MLEKIQNKFTRFLYLKEYGVYPFYPLMYPTLFVIGMVGYSKLGPRRDVALCRYMWRVLRGQLHHPEILAAMQLCAPDEATTRRRSSLTFKVPHSQSYVTSRKLTEAPEFDRPIGNHTFHIGREAVLGCSVLNLGKHKVGWLKAEDQTVLSLHDRVVLSPRYSVTLDAPDTWQLRIRPLRAEDRGCYMCQINTQPVMKWQIGCIDVYVPPDIINEDTSADVSATELDNVTMVCTATGHPPPKITWRREDHEPMLLKKIGSRDFYKVDSYVGSSLLLWKVDRRQMGAFFCIASNDVPPAVSKRITLSVNFPPTVIVPNQLLGAPLGTDVVLECTVEAYPNTINYWLKNRAEMLLDGPKYTIYEERTSYKVMMKLTIRRFSRSDIGTYNCVSTNSLGRSEGTLRLYEIKLYPSSQSAAEVNVGGLTEGAVKSRPIHGNASIRGLEKYIILLIVAIVIYF